jgi:hypothetical protein
MIVVEQGPQLNTHPDLPPLPRAWLDGHEQLGRAGTELERYFEVGGDGAGSSVAASDVAPLWSAREWRENWAAEAVRDQPDEESRDHFTAAVQRLAGGEADPIVTGQQPGFLGGPIYTLLKIATAIVLAEMRSAAGRPTVPVFWSADDDDDLREALAPYLFDPARETLLRADPDAFHAGETAAVADRMVGALPGADYGAGAAAWLLECASTSDLAADLAVIYEDGIRAQLSWGRIQRRALLRVFRGSGLVVVSGNDSGLHAAADRFYARAIARRDAWRAALEAGGRRLQEAGFARPLAPTAGERYLHLREGDRRLTLAEDLAEGLPAAPSLRPGVALRAAVQDWLLRPAATVVGPGEIAYLKQLAGVHEVCGLPRSPVLPRLFAWIVPRGYAEQERRHEDQDRADPAALAAAATSVADGAGDLLRAALVREIGLSGARAEAVTREQRTAWIRSTRRLLEREARRRRRRREPALPAWLRPAGQRQERSLAALCAAALWGDDLAPALLHAARRHVDAGLDGRWREFRIAVPEPWAAGGDEG